MDARDHIPLKTPEVIPLVEMFTSQSLMIGSAFFAVILIAGGYPSLHRVWSGLTFRISLVVYEPDVFKRRK